MGTVPPGNTPAKPVSKEGLHRPRLASEEQEGDPSPGRSQRTAGEAASQGTGGINLTAQPGLGSSRRT